MGNKQTMSRNILYQLKKHNKSRAEVCDALGIGYSTFTAWANGGAYPRIDKIEMLAEYFGISKAELIEEQTTSSALRTPAEIGEVIRTRREEMGITPEQLAELAYTTPNTIRKWEKGKIAEPRTDLLENLSKALNLPTAILRGVPQSTETIQRQKLISAIDRALSDAYLTDDEIQDLIKYIEFILLKRTR